MSISFNISFKEKHLEIATQRTEYDDLLEYVQKSLVIDDREETFIYVIPNDHSGHIRLCQRLLGSMFDSAEKNAGTPRVMLKVYTAGSFMQYGFGQTSSQGQPLQLTQIPKGHRSGQGHRFNKYSKNSGSTSITNSSAPQKQQVPQGPTLVSNVYPASPSQPLTQVQPQPVIPKQPTIVRTKHADAIDQFVKEYQVASSEFNVSIEANHNTSNPAEHKAGDTYSLSLVLKALGTSNIGKDFALCKIAGNGSPPSFSLPLLKPQVSRSISISVDFTDEEETSFWAVRQTSTGQWFGTILSVTILKIQKKLLLRSIEFAEAQKLIDNLKFKTTN